MSEIVKRLREYRMYNPQRDSSHHPICDEAAARIERLEKALRDIHASAKDNHLIANLARAALEEK